METTNKQEQKQRGGRRDGAGRPATKNNVRSIALRIPADVAEILDEQEHKSAYIIEAIREYYKSQQKKTILGIEISYTKTKK